MSGGKRSMYAVVETGGKQYKVSKGDLIKVEKLGGEVGEKVELDQVLLIKDDSGMHVGTPVVEGVKVVGRITSQRRGKKVVIFKYKRRTNYHLKQGHRQHHAWIEIEDIISAQGGESGPQKGRRKLQKREG
jgi:large subunit ribosomal protein L21